MNKTEKWMIRAYNIGKNDGKLSDLEDLFDEYRKEEHKFKKV